MFLDPNPKDNNIAEQHLQTDQRIDWDSAERMCATVMTNIVVDKSTPNAEPLSIC